MIFEIDVTLPIWAKWRTQDKCGTWVVWRDKPQPYKNGYWHNDVGELDDAEYLLSCAVILVPIGRAVIENWKEQIFEIT